jgi:hypothetical protein
MFFDAFSRFVIVHPNADVDSASVTRKRLTLNFSIWDVEVR